MVFTLLIMYSYSMVVMFADDASAYLYGLLWAPWYLYTMILTLGNDDVDDSVGECDGGNDGGDEDNNSTATTFGVYKYAIEEHECYFISQ